MSWGHNNWFPQWKVESVMNLLMFFYQNTLGSLWERGSFRSVPCSSLGQHCSRRSPLGKSWRPETLHLHPILYCFETRDFKIFSRNDIFVFCQTSVRWTRNWVGQLLDANKLLSVNRSALQVPHATCWVVIRRRSEWDSRCYKCGWAVPKKWYPLRGHIVMI